jgi:hypothetical protein
MNGIHPEMLEQLKEYYKPGDRVVLVSMNDPYTHIPPGTIGKVLCVDSVGTLHVIWNNSSTLGVVFGEDECRKLTADEPD